jgi:hypothetical protein
MGVMAILGGLHFAKGKSGKLAVAVMINIAIAAQQLGGGAPTYTLQNEISSLRLRAKTQSIAIAFNFILNWAWNLVTPYIYQPDTANLGAASAFIFVGTTGLCLIVAFFVIPETNGRSESLSPADCSNADWFSCSRRSNGSSLRKQGPRPPLRTDGYRDFGKAARS